MKAVGHASGAAVQGSILTFSILFYIACGLRLYTRIYIVRQPWWDDALIAISFVFNLIMAISMCIQVPYGLGQHVEEVPPDRLRTMLFWFWLSIWNYFGAQGFAKLSILFQYLRIFGNVKKFRIACYCVIAAVVFYLLWGAFSTAFICFPASGFWDLEAVAAGRAHCQKQWTVKVPIWFFNASLNMATDIATTVLPLPVIKTLNLPKKQRISLMLVFGIGGFVIIISIIRLSGLYAIAVSHDPTYDNPLAAIWSATEANLTGLASCLPVLKGMIAKYFPNLFKTSHAVINQPYGSGQNTSKLSERGHTRKSATIWGKRETEINIEEETISSLRIPLAYGVVPAGAGRRRRGLVPWRWRRLWKSERHGPEGTRRQVKSISSRYCLWSGRDCRVRCGRNTLFPALHLLNGRGCARCMHGATRRRNRTLAKQLYCLQ